MTDTGSPLGASSRPCSVCRRPMTSAGSRHRTCLPPHPVAPLHFTEFDTRLAAYALVADRAGRILLAGSLNRGPDVQWSLPGGGVDFEEAPIEALVREVGEETGRDVAVGALLGVHTDRIDPARRRGSNGRPMKTVQLIYAAEDRGAAREQEPGATSQWFTVAEVTQLRRRASVDVALGFAHASVGSGASSISTPRRLAA